jgi:carboxyl-terminal processing protease
MRARRGGLAGLLLVALVGTGLAAAAPPGRADSYGAITLYAESMSLIHGDYVDELSWRKMVRDGIRGAVQGLDGDSTVLEAAPAPRAGSAAADAGDVGLALTRRNGGLVVVAAPAGLPARGAGIQSGDRILTLDGEAVAATAPEAVARRLRGRPGRQVVLTIIRSGWAEPKAFTLARVDPPAAVPTDRTLRDGILYVRIPSVDEAAGAELARLLAATPADHARGLVLDLRDTAGGRIEAVPAIASLFLDPGSVIARVERRTSGSPAVLTATTASIRWTGPVAVLVDRGTASAAEVLAGAMQDTRRAVIVGAPTFGDASTQSAIPLSDHSTLSLTTARYLTPGRHPITGHGIAPDVSAPVPSPRAPVGADAELELAFQVVKAAGILQNGAGPAAGGAEARG